MSISDEILNYAVGKRSFSRAKLLRELSNFAEESVSQQLYRLVKSNRLERVEHGVYRLPPQEFPISDEILQLNKMLKKRYPFTNFCVWSSDIFMPFMHHIPNLNYVYIDVEREAMENVFHFLKEKLQKPVFLSPNKEEYQRYITGNSAVIIRVLISEAPLQNIGDLSITTIEKILVDIIGDIEFHFLQGAEISYFYHNVLDKHNINKKKLIRYATRRGRREQVEQLYKTHYDTTRISIHQMATKNCKKK